MKYPERVDRYVAMSNGHPAVYALGPLEQKLKGWYVLFFQIRSLSEWALRAGDWWFLRRLSSFRRKCRIGSGSWSVPAVSPPG